MPKYLVARYFGNNGLWAQKDLCWCYCGHHCLLPKKKKMANFVAFLFHDVFFMRFFQFYLELWYICWVRRMCSTVVHTSERTRICRIFVSSCQCITPSIRNVPVVPVVYICSTSSTTSLCSTSSTYYYYYCSNQEQ